MAAKTKIYVASNLDGYNSGMTAATNLKDAAEKLRATVNELRTYGWHEGSAAEAAEYAAAGGSGTLYRPINPIEGYTPWRSQRWSRTEIVEARDKAREDLAADAARSAEP